MSRIVWMDPPYEKLRKQTNSKKGGRSSGGRKLDSQSKGCKFESRLIEIQDWNDVKDMPWSVFLHSLHISGSIIEKINKYRKPNLALQINIFFLIRNIFLVVVVSNESGSSIMNYCMTCQMIVWKGLMSTPSSHPIHFVLTYFLDQWMTIFPLCERLRTYVL